MLLARVFCFEFGRAGVVMMVVEESMVEASRS